MEQLHMKISDLLLQSDWIFLDFLNIKLGGVWGKIPRPGIFIPTLYY